MQITRQVRTIFLFQNFFYLLKIFIFKRSTQLIKIFNFELSYSIEEPQRINYGEGFVAERMQLLQQARKLAEQDSNMAHSRYKENHDKNAS